MTLQSKHIVLILNASWNWKSQHVLQVLAGHNSPFTVQEYAPTRRYILGLPTSPCYSPVSPHLAGIKKTFI
jgi:hypothetical protein